MKTIHRFRLRNGAQKISMPRYAEVLSVHTKGSEPMLWALVSDENEHESRLFYVAATGENLDSVVASAQMEFIGTVLLGDGLGTLVFHVFEMGPLSGATTTRGST